MKFVTLIPFEFWLYIVTIIAALYFFGVGGFVGAVFLMVLLLAG